MSRCNALVPPASRLVVEVTVISALLGAVRRIRYAVSSGQREHERQRALLARSLADRLLFWSGTRYPDRELLSALHTEVAALREVITLALSLVDEPGRSGEISDRLRDILAANIESSGDG